MALRWRAASNHLSSRQRPIPRGCSCRDENHHTGVSELPYFGKSGWFFALGRCGLTQGPGPLYSAGFATPTAFKAQGVSSAPVAELVDALDSKSSSARSAGSIPARGTNSASPCRASRGAAAQEADRAKRERRRTNPQRYSTGPSRVPVVPTLFRAKASTPCGRRHSAPLIEFARDRKVLDHDFRRIQNSPAVACLRKPRPRVC